MASGRVIHTEYRWAAGALHPRPPTDKNETKGLTAADIAIARVNAELLHGKRKSTAAASRSGNGKSRRHKRTTNGHGLFDYTRHDDARQFTCARCQRTKTAKIVVRWTDTAGTTGTICNGCYGYLLSRPAADVGPARLSRGGTARWTDGRRAGSSESWLPAGIRRMAAHLGPETQFSTAT